MPSSVRMMSSPELVRQIVENNGVAYHPRHCGSALDGVQQGVGRSDPRPAIFEKTPGANEQDHMNFQILKQLQTAIETGEWTVAPCQ